MSKIVTARDIALYFLGKVHNEKKLKPSEIAKTVNQAKQLLNKYSANHIVKAIDYYTINPPGEKPIYSLGYFFFVMDSFVEQQLTLEEMEKKKEILQPRKATGGTNNADKTNRKIAKRRLGKKYNFDMFEGPE